MNIRSLLPETSFVPVEVPKVRGGLILWKNQDFHSLDLNDYMYCLPLDASEGRLVDFGRSKTFYAERYGGEGLGSNGGGVRCGTDGVWQIKGIGKIPELCGETTDFFHSYGGLSVFEAMLEAIWGEVCNIALPHGGVRTSAIVDTLGTVPVKFPKKGGSSRTRRAIAIREATARPAHYMRAMYYREPGVLYGGQLDAFRTKNAIRSLNATMPHFIGKCQDGKGLSDGVKAWVVLHAEQLAAARAKRIMHGSLTPSNISMNGSWLDFGSISSLSDYGKIIIPRGAPNFLNEEAALIRQFRGLVFYINKYAGDEEEISPEAVVQLFSEAFKSQLKIEFAKLLGLTSSQAADAPQVLIDSAYAAIKMILNEEAMKPFLILHADDNVLPSMPARFSDQHLPSLLTRTAFGRHAHEIANRLDGHVKSDAIKEKLAAAVSAIRQWVVSHQDTEFRKHVELGMVVECVRRNSSVPDLYRTNLYPNLEMVITSDASFSSLLESLKGCAQTVWGEGDVISLKPIVGFELGFSHERINYVSSARDADVFDLAVARALSEKVEECGGNLCAVI